MVRDLYYWDKKVTFDGIYAYPVASQLVGVGIYEVVVEQLIDLFDLTCVMNIGVGGLGG